VTPKEPRYSWKPCETSTTRVLGEPLHWFRYAEIWDHLDDVRVGVVTEKNAEWMCQILNKQYEEDLRRAH
jgi:hypothetical protein